MSHSAKKQAVKLKFLLDENVDVRVSTFLKKQSFSVIICPKGLSNGAVLSLAKKGSRILLTNDQHFANPEIYRPKDFDGIVVLRIHPPELEKITNVLGKLLKAFIPEDFPGKIFIVGEEKVEIIE